MCGRGVEIDAAHDPAVIHHGQRHAAGDALRCPAAGHHCPPFLVEGWISLLRVRGGWLLVTRNGTDTGQDKLVDHREGEVVVQESHAHRNTFGNRADSPTLDDPELVLEVIHRRNVFVQRFPALGQ